MGNNIGDSLVASFWFEIILRTIGNVNAIPGTGPKVLPAPKIYVVPVVLWGMFDLLADFGQERIASALAWLTVIATLILGGTTKTVINAIRTFTEIYTPQAAPASTPTNPVPASGGMTQSSNRVV